MPATAFSGGEFPKLEAWRPAELALRLKLDDSAKALLAPGLDVARYVGRLAGSQLMPAAVTVLAHALPKREAVWWASLAARHTLAFFPSADGGAAFAVAIDAAEQWVRQPSEFNRRLAEAAALAAGLDNPAGLAAQAVFWSGGSIAPDTVPPVPPGELLTGKAVAGAVKLAGLKRARMPSDDRFRAFIAMAFDIAQGGDGRGVAFGGPA